MGSFTVLAPLFAEGEFQAQIMQMLPFIAIAVLFYFIILRPGSQEQKRRAEMLKGLKKNDKVYTSSGIIGVVANMSADGREVTLKIDDNARIRVLRRTVEGLYNEPSSESSAKPDA